MEPTKKYLMESPRDIDADAFFSSDRSATRDPHSLIAYDRPRPTAEQEAKGTRGANPTPVDFGIWRNRFELKRSPDALNPLPVSQLGQDKKPDPAFRDWYDVIQYRSFASRSVASMPASARVRVVILFGVGSEAYRHGLCSVIDVAAEPTILIIVPGIEDGPYSGDINLKNPWTNETKTIKANTRWGIGITNPLIGAVVAQHRKDVSYDVVVLACYSTGALGFSGVINKGLVSIDALERVVIFDCLYSYTGQALAKLNWTKSSVKVIAYVASGGGNDFVDNKHPTYETLIYGNKPFIHYVNLFFDPAYHAAATARVINEGTLPDGDSIVTDLPASFEIALRDLVGRLPPRGTLVSDPSVYKAIKGTLPSNATSRISFWNANKKLIADFQDMHGIYWACFENAQLLGWPTPVGEEWHDLLLVEFAWEYLI
jgi:hypothetical protein